MVVLQTRCEGPGAVEGVGTVDEGGERFAMRAG